MPWPSRLLFLRSITVVVNSFDQLTGRFVIGVLRDKFPFECSLEDALAKARRTGKAVVHYQFRCIDQGKLVIDFCNDHSLLLCWRKRELDFRKPTGSQVGDVDSDRSNLLEASILEISQKHFECKGCINTIERAKSHESICEAGTRDFVSIHCRATNEFHALALV